MTEGRDPDPKTDTTPDTLKQESLGRLRQVMWQTCHLSAKATALSSGCMFCLAKLENASGCLFQSEDTCRAVSAALLSGVDPKELIEQLRGIRCVATATAQKEGQGQGALSCPDVIGRATEEAMGNSSELPSVVLGNICPECGSQLRKEEGCLVCRCGFSRCG